MDTISSRDIENRPIKIAVVAMGGQGGGVLTGWISDAAEASGYVTQITSVPGVAQRTGATIYYLEIIRPLPGSPPPVLALMPVPGDVDVVIASEMMEAGRAMLRGLVTPDRTVLIASSQRAYAVAEKEKVGDGTGDSGVVLDAAGIAAKRSIIADYADVAERHGSVISASLLGALAASAALPLPRTAFESAIKSSGVGVTTSLAAFAEAHRVAERNAPPTFLEKGKRLPDLPPRTADPELDRILIRIRDSFPPLTQRMIFAGVKHLVDYQDVAYAQAYLDTLERIADLDRHHGGDAKSWRLTNEIARQLARAMAYDDPIRVADLKTRTTRSQRVETEVGIKPEAQVLHTTEHFHPRMEEVCATLPTRIGAAIESRPRLYKLLDRFVSHPRRIRTDSIMGYGKLYLIAGLKSRRRGTLRHGREQAHITNWMTRIESTVTHNYDLSVEIARVRRLIKGYSDTLSRGLSKYDRVLDGAARVASRHDAADWVRRLHQAALIDENGLALDGALRTIDTLESPVSESPVSPSESTTA